MICVIATVLNEGDSIRGLMDSLVWQTRQPDAVIIVDGGSRDNTAQVLYSYEGKLPLRVILAPGCGISEGRNIAIRAADANAIIAVTDAGVVLAPDWLENITRPLRESESVNVVSGFFEADPHTPFELAMGATVLPLADEIRAESFLPSSRSVAFRKSAWEAVGGYPEWLDYCEDLIFDLRLKASLGEFALAKDAIAYFRPRSSFRAFFKQYRLYARGDGKADLWRKRHAIRYATYLIGVPLIALLGTRVHPLWWGLALIGGFVYTRTPYRRLPTLIESARKRGRFPITPFVIGYVAALIPVIRVVGDVAKMIGYPVGWLWRLRNNPPDWR